MLKAAVDGAGLRHPAADPRAVRGLKFSVALPEDVAQAVVSARLAESGAAASVLRERMWWLSATRH